MAEIENTIVNRPALSLPPSIAALLSLWPVALGIAGAGGWLYHLEGATAANSVAIVDLRERTKSIEDGRTVGLQRLAAVEEAVKGQKDILSDIRSKLDRVLMGRMR